MVAKAKKAAELEPENPQADDAAHAALLIAKGLDVLEGAGDIAALEAIAQVAAKRAVQVGNSQTIAADPYPPPPSARQISENITEQMEKRAARNRKRKLDAMDRPTVNMQALEIIRKHTEGDTDETSAIIPPAPAAPVPEPAGADGEGTGASGGNTKGSGVLQSSQDGVDPPVNPKKPRSSGSKGKGAKSGDGGEGVSVQSVLQ